MMALLAKISFRRMAYSLVLLLTIFLNTSTASALSAAQQDIFNKGIHYFNAGQGTDTVTTTGQCGTDISGGTTTSGSGGGVASNSLDQVKAFASEPVNSTWNISDSTVEQWFLKQNNAQAVIARFGITPSNIGQITSAIKAAGASPVFFYIVTVNEGGGAAGFINHYSTFNDPSPLSDGPANATTDSEYMLSESQTTADGPATGGGEPGDMPTAETTAILDSLPIGSLGVYYTQATSAITAELEYLSGKTGDWNPGDSASPATIFGSPLEETMQNIQDMGGDPSQGGTTISTGGSGDCTTGTGGVTGQGIAKAISWAVMIANNDGYGYDQDYDSNQTIPGQARETGWTKWQSDPSCTNQCGSFDCSSFIAAALTEAGYFKTNPNFGTGTDANGPEATDLIGAGFKKVADSATTSQDLLPGDILLWDGHTSMYIGNDQTVAAHENEFDGINGGQVGDQTGQEISVKSLETSLSSDPWIGVYRAQN